MYDIAWAGRVPEESNESFDSSLAEIKGRVRMVISTTQTIVVTTAHTQCNIQYWKRDQDGGKLDMKNSGKEQSNGKGMNCIGFSIVMDKLLVMYPDGYGVHQ